MIQQGSPLNPDQILHAQQWTNYWEFKLWVSAGFQHAEMTFFSLSSFRLGETLNWNNDHARPRRVEISSKGCSVLEGIQHFRIDALTQKVSPESGY